MWSATSRLSGRDHWITAVLTENIARICENDGDGLQIARISLSRPLHRRQDRYHQIADIAYRDRNRLRTTKVWLKYRADFEELYRLHCLYHGELEGKLRLLPKPYFHASSEGHAVIGMEHIDGVSLRNRLLWRTMSGKSTTLAHVFADIGRAMRVFHDLFPSQASRDAHALAENAMLAADNTDYLAKEEKRHLRKLISQAEKASGPETKLALIKIHNDWVLRNVLVTRSDSFRLVDLDSMRAANDSRWYDVTYFLINLESQTKYPLIGRDDIGNLSRSFLSGYLEQEPPEGLAFEQIAALLYMVKVQYWLGATIRPPLYRMYRKTLGPLYLRSLKTSIMQGRFSTALHAL